ncbi:hypothetical protein HCA61_00940 [Rhodococcus sp. HNM0563]|uniref:hypothetical protein n=1 Tax=unclassified Rhodococcus (in: high G+C Gram-positive bacteria) TaxID=192944 RepID=UPI00146EC68C|nr:MULTISPECIES: hypothetical protein [unclassified Rhodococcus (in: high G+C Gram-positive bacteria)]MCK0091127.1 hypothetical protein [Rhodococcus sp. F64268]NLU60833.1 hypothetical protein [Rhodococcus sp. HNM0563]
MRLQLDLPSGLSLIPLQRDIPLRTAAAEALVASATTQDSKADISSVLATSELLSHCDLVLAGALALPDSEPSEFAAVTLAVRRLPDRRGPFNRPEARDELARALADTLARANPAAVVQYRRLGCGPVVLALRASLFDLPGDMTVNGKAVLITSDSFQALVPLPGGAEMAVLDLSSSSRELWPRFVDIALTMVDSIRIGSSDDAHSDRAER